MICYCALTIAVVALVPQPSIGQVRSEDPRKNARVHVGPLYINPSVYLRELGIDTNVFDATQNPQKDFTATLTPALATALPLAKRGLIKVSTAGDLVYYQKFSSERSFDPRVAVRGETYLNRLTLFADLKYTRTRARPNFEIDKRSRSVDDAATGGAEIGLSPKIGVEISGGRHTTKFNGDEVFLGTSLAQQLNYNSVAYGATGRWKRTPLTTFLVRGESRRDRFLESRIRDNDSKSVVAGVELKPHALISGTGEIGVRNFRPTATYLPAFVGVIGAATLSTSIGGSLGLGFTAKRDIGYSYAATTPYFIDNSIGGSVRRHVAGNFDVTVEGERHRYNYRDILPAVGQQSLNRPHQIDTSDSYGASLGYRIGKSGRFGVGLSYWTRWSQNATVTAAPNYGSLRIRSTFAYGL